ncbi:protein SCAR3 isoform X2 [Arabidopsis lyrata subsp. lyrata]|uniref:protein SCAR3 isoform X2 n=1 Tax=Arabidopsis lyrata subsp. lyrata TaxID=81972 RepID=UPI000A29B342|nr:protein SCAR3 isoform X2 [Arabidopsis lyrata subsp. lyrata]|eukprot:XP_020869211.1 protein SCAR3 isoform X2 [Arabidopsis lyrata subsp. lyrata]
MSIVKTPKQFSMVLQLLDLLGSCVSLVISLTEIFHGIQEEVMATASRSNQLKIRLQHIEATVPPLEKAMLAQTTHIHFAYTGGLEWHLRIPITQNYLIYDDLPHIIMDPYEECRDPPRLHLLDKFDINGPGSCLKRYSDPTYFRRASSNLIQGNKKIQKDKNLCKMKKKKTSSRSRDMSRLASMANQNARKTFTSFSFSGRTSSTKTTSTSDMEKRFDFQDLHSRSFESRSGSGYNECLSTATSSLKTGERPKGVFVSSSLTPGSCTIASVLSECETEDAHDNFQFSPSQGQAARGSSCVSWDEKVEIVESLGLQTEEASEMMETNPVVDKPDEKPSYGGTGGVDFHSKDIENDKSESGLQKCTGIDEVRGIKTVREIVGEPRDSEHETESEGDCFVDALNTIESESENKQGHQTSQVSSSCGVADEMLEKSVCEQKTEQNCYSVEDSYRSMDGLIANGFKNEENASSANVADEMHQKNPQVGSDINRLQKNDLCANKDMRNDSGGKDIITFTFVPGLENSLADSSNPLIHHGLQENQEPEAESSGDLEAIKIWTNGGLLGLKPSKPPVLAVQSSLSPDCKTGERTVGFAEAGKDKSDDLIENASHRRVLNNASLATPGTQNPISSSGMALGIVDQRESHETSSGVFGLSHRLLTNGFRRKDSFAHDRKTVPATIPENDEVTTERRRFCDQDIDDKTFVDPFRNEAPIDWITSSPPLQHMKISLNPADTLQASRLKLKFSDGNNTYNTFSSFQLLPEAATFLPDSYSDDDDTFCRSSPYMSDTDYLSDNHSLSYSEQWEESSDSHGRKEQELYDSFHESRHIDNNAEASPLGIKSESGCVAVNFSYLQNPAEPLPPPFPPVQWMVSKTPSEKIEDKTQSLQLQDAIRFAFEKHISLPTMKKELPSMVTSAPKPEIKVHLKNNVREEKQSANAKETETGDFLQQIRTQQFNLRPVVMTTTSSAAATTDPIINTKISAILEKANSIRQAVASKEGDESDTWSDT